MKIAIMRHGAVDGPAALYGHTDIHCTSGGLAEMARQYASLPQVSEIVSSPKVRCRQFAEKMAEQHNLPLTIIEDLRELSFGQWDGVAFDDLQQVWPDVECYFNNPEEVMPPDGEPLQDFYQRVSLAWKMINDTVTTDAPLILCHGAVIRMILANVMEMHYGAVQWFSRLDIRYASITHISRSDWENQPLFRIQSIGSKP